MANIKLLVISSCYLIREGFTHLCHTEEGLECVSTVADVETALKLSNHTGTDVIVVDIATHEEYPAEWTERLKSFSPTASILLISGKKDIDHVRSCMLAGVSGYLLREALREEVLYALRMVHLGKTVYSVGDVTRVLRDSTSVESIRLQYEYDGLNQREFEVLKLVAKGISNKQVSAKLQISENTVATHLAHIFSKLGVQSRTEAVVHALNRGWFTTDKDRPSEAV